MKGQGRGDGVVVGGRVGADLFVFTDVFVEGRVGAHQRPDRLLFRLADIEKPGADRRQQPLVQAAAEVIAIQVVAFEGKVGEGVCAVDEDLDALLPSQAHHIADRQDLPRKVGDLGELDDFGPGRDRLADAVDEDRAETAGESGTRSS